MEADMTIHENLRDAIREMQFNDCEGAKAQIQVLRDLNRELLRNGCITPEDDAQKLRMMQSLDYIQMIFESFIPPKQ